MKKDSSPAVHQLSTRDQQTLRRALRAASLGFLVLFALAQAPANRATEAAPLVAGPSAQTSLSGEWTAEFKREKADDRIHFSFRHRGERGNSNISGSDYALEDFQGLTREQVTASASTPVSFRLVREAGTVECEGSFRNGNGSGTWRLIPNQSFRSAMGTRGYNDLTDREMLTATMLDLTAQFVDDLKSAGFDSLTYDDVIKARIFKVTPQFVAEMKTLGFDNLGLEELVKARIFGIDAGYVRQVREMGFDAGQMEELVKLRIFKVTPEFLAELKAEGFSDVSVEEAVKLRIFKIDGEFIRQAKASGRADLSVEDLVELRIHGKVR